MTKNDNCPNCDAPLQGNAPRDASPERPPTVGFQSADGGEAPDQRKEGETDRHGGTTKSERSSLALWGLLLPILAVGLIPVAALLALALGAEEGGSWDYVAGAVFTVASLAVVTGIGFSIVALARIQRSNGKLHGTWMAIVGVIVPLLVCVPVSGLVHVETARAPIAEPGSSVLEPAEEGGTIDPARRLEIDDEATGTRDRGE